MLVLATFAVHRGIRTKSSLFPNYICYHKIYECSVQSGKTIYQKLFTLLKQRNVYKNLFSYVIWNIWISKLMNHTKLVGFID